MSKERLEEIKKENSFYLGFKTNSHATLTHTMPIDDINWLIEQAERMEILERELKDWKEVFYLLKSDHEKLENFQTGEWEIKYKTLEQSE